MNFINKKLSKEKVLNFELKLASSSRAKKALKNSSGYLKFLARLLT